MGTRGRGCGVAVGRVAVEAACEALVALGVGCRVVRVGAVAFGVAVVARSLGVVAFGMGGQTACDDPNPWEWAAVAVALDPSPMALEHTAVAVLFWLHAKLYGPVAGGVSTLCVGVGSGGHGAEALGQRLGDVQRSRHFTARTGFSQGSDVDVGADAQALRAHCPQSPPRFLRLQRARRRKEGKATKEGQERNQVVRFNGLVPVCIGIVRESRVRLCRGLVAKQKTPSRQGRAGPGSSSSKSCPPS